MNKILKMLLYLSILLVNIAMCTIVEAESKVIEATGDYTLGPEDTLQKAQDGALNEALRFASEQVGVYVEARTSVENFHITMDAINTATNHNMRIKSKRFERELTSAGDIHVKAYIIVEVDVDSMIRELKPPEPVRPVLEGTPAVAKDNVIVPENGYTTQMFVRNPNLDLEQINITEKTNIGNYIKGDREHSFASFAMTYKYLGINHEAPMIMSLMLEKKLSRSVRITHHTTVESVEHSVVFSYHKGDVVISPTYPPEFLLENNGLSDKIVLKGLISSGVSNNIIKVSSPISEKKLRKIAQADVVKLNVFTKNGEYVSYPFDKECVKALKKYLDYELRYADQDNIY